MDNFTGRNVLVTGGTGFVGSHLVDELIRKGAHVVTTYLQDNPLSYFNQNCLEKKAVMERIDLVHFDQVFDLVTKHSIDFIFHLAAQPLVDVAYYNPRRTLESNINGTINLLESMRLYPKVTGMIFASSDKAYGKHGKKKYKEDDQLKGDHPYEVSKSAADLICNSYVKTYKLPVVITRFGNIYGEGDLNFSRIIPGIMRALIQKEELQIRSDGTFIRDYLYVKDVVEGYLLLADNIDKVKGEAYNFGSEDTLSVLDLIQVIETTLQKKIPYSILNQANNEISFQSLDSSKIKSRLGWAQKYSIKDVLADVYKWYSSLNCY